MTTFRGICDLTPDEFVEKMFASEQTSLAELPKKIAGLKKDALTCPPEQARRVMALVRAYERKLQEAA